MDRIMDFLVNSLAMLFGKGGNWFIIALAVANVGIFVYTIQAIKKAEDMFNPRNDKVNGVSASMGWDSKEISELKKRRGKLVRGYTWYANLTAIFPLLGIMGTVAALVTYSDETMMENFMVALSTTLMGVFFAIVFKGMDAMISAPLDVFIANAEYVIHDYEKTKGVVG